MRPLRSNAPRTPFAALALLGLLCACGEPEGGPGLPGAGLAPSGGGAQAELRVCPGGPTLEGIDVSHYNGAVAWAQVKASGRSFAFAKATEG